MGQSRRQFIEVCRPRLLGSGENPKNVPQWHGFRGIERVTGVHHTTVIIKVKKWENLADAYRAQSHS